MTDKYTVGPVTARVWSAGGGRTLLYLHGLEQHPGDASFLHALAGGHRVVAPEHPGFGESTGIEELVDILDLTLYLRRFVESLEAGPVDVVGHSLGGMFAAELAAIAPQVVNRLVLIDAFGLWLDEAPLPDLFVMGERQLAAAKWADPAAAPDEVTLPICSVPPTPAEVQINRARNLGAATKFLWPIPDRGLRRRLPYIQAPTLVLHGEADGLIPVVYAKTLAGLITGAQLQVIPNAGHLPMIEQEAETVAAILRFLDA